MQVNQGTKLGRDPPLRRGRGARGCPERPPPRARARARAHSHLPCAAPAHRRRRAAAQQPWPSPLATPPLTRTSPPPTPPPHLTTTLSSPFHPLSLPRLVKRLGEGNWSMIARALNEAFDRQGPLHLGRIGKQCREVRRIWGGGLHACMMLGRLHGAGRVAGSAPRSRGGIVGR
jgi:hypothetical protein